MSFSLFLPIEKVDKESRMVWGYASTPTKDLQGEVVTLEAIKAALPDYMQWANIREMHTSSAVGVTKEANVDEKGLFIGAKIVDDAAWKKCQESSPGAGDRVYKGFSIGGSKLEKLGDTIKSLRLTEISLVDRPANPDCKIEVAKAAGIASAEVNHEGNGNLLEKFLDTARGILGLSKNAHVHPAYDGTAPLNANRLPLPTHYALEGHQPNVIPLRVDNADAHPTNAMQVDLREPGKLTPESERMELTDEELADLNRKMANGDFEKREFSEKQRKHLASTGAAMSDGSFPIASEKDLRNAIEAVGRASDPAAAKAHICERAKALQLTHLLPADWPGSTKEEKSLMSEIDLQKRLSATHKSAIDSAKKHLQKAMDCHGKACTAVNALHKCMGLGKADGAEDASKHVRAIAQHLSDMGDHHELAMHAMGKASNSWTGEGKEDPKSGENGDVSGTNTSSVDLLSQGHLTEGSVRGSDFMGAGDSPYSASAVASMVKAAVAEVTGDLTKQLQELTTENAFMKGQMSALERMPSGAPRPRLFGSVDRTTLDMLGAGDPKAEVNAEISKAYQNIDVNDPESATRAASRIIGLRAASPGLFGKSLTDASYKGGAGK